jgi:hypothetical protein
MRGTSGETQKTKQNKLQNGKSRYYLLKIALNMSRLNSTIKRHKKTESLTKIRSKYIFSAINCLDLGLKF